MRALKIVHAVGCVLLAALGVMIGWASVWDLIHKPFDPTDLGLLGFGVACLVMSISSSVMRCRFVRGLEAAYQAARMHLDRKPEDAVPDEHPLNVADFLAERLNPSVQHAFEQLVGVSVQVCRVCSEWPGHHNHVGEPTAWCSCDSCRGAREAARHRLESAVSDERPFNLSDLFAQATEQFLADDELFGQPVHSRERVIPSGPSLVADKLTAYVPMSEELAMEYGLIPDTRPPAPKPTRWQRFRGWRREKIAAARKRVGLRIAGIDPDELNSREEW